MPGPADVTLPGASALTVDTPAVYASGGPILFLPTTSDRSAALPAAREAAPFGRAAIVVNQASGDTRLGGALAIAGSRPHCDYFAGTL